MGNGERLTHRRAVRVEMSGQLRVDRGVQPRDQPEEHSLFKALRIAALFETVLFVDRIPDPRGGVAGVAGISLGVAREVDVSGCVHS